MIRAWYARRIFEPAVAYDPYHLHDTHVLVSMWPGLSFTDNPEAIEIGLEGLFASMQGEVWSPNGEMNYYIRSIGTDHTSMCMGDLFELYTEAQRHVYRVEASGFRIMQHDYDPEVTKEMVTHGP